MTLARMIRMHKVPERPRLLDQGLREIEERDVPQVCDLFARYMRRFDMSPVFNEDEIRHQFLSGMGEGRRGGETWKHPREGQVVWTYVVEVRPLFPIVTHTRLTLTTIVHTTAEPQDAQDHRLLLVLLAAVYDHQAPQAQSAERGVPLLLRHRDGV